MRRPWALLAVGLLMGGLAVGAIACKSSSSNNTSATKTAQYRASLTPKATAGTTPQATARTPQSTTSTTPGASATVIITQNATAGAILTDASGKALYKYANDQTNVSNCSATCAQNWPPLTVASGTTPTAGTGVTGQLGTIQRADGTTQVTLGGSPLYYFASDTSAGDATGNGVGGFSLVKTGG
jgi:predicted lipoprotein with Yx(FWY)xxD motif